MKRPVMRLAPAVLITVLSLAVTVPLAHADEDPTASFTFSPARPVVGEQVTFTSTSTDSDGTIERHRWDLDGDGEYDPGRTSTTVTYAFTDPGQKTVKLQVIDDDNDRGTRTENLTVDPNAAPTAAFSASPASPALGEAVTFSSSSIDPDGRPLAHAWDLDGDGSFDDGNGASAAASFASDGIWRVGLRVTDSGGTEDTETLEVVVRSPTAAETAGGTTQDPGHGTAPGTAQDVPLGTTAAIIAPRMLSPFPLVRIRGVTTRRGVRVDALSVKTPGATRILVLCKGRGCPYARKAVLAKHAPARLRSIALPGFSRRHVRAGAVLQVYVTRAGAYGKYTRFAFRGNLAPPKRTDRCTAAGRATPRRCTP